MRKNHQMYVFGIILVIVVILYYRNNREGFTNRQNVYVFYHIFCNKNTLPVVQDQTTKIIYSGLYDEATKVYCFVTGEPSYIDDVKKYLETLPSKFIVAEVAMNDRTYERYTLTRIPDYIEDKDVFLYIHSKGVSREDSQLKNVRLWSSYMEYYLIKKYKECLDKLMTKDVVGVMYTTNIEPVMTPHFAGNFWWSTGKYYKRLSKTKIGDDYYDTERYLFRQNPTYHVMDDNRISQNGNPYFTPIYPKIYM
jgi:hypothetical protein